jgi:hypothetical protein
VTAITTETPKKPVPTTDPIPPRPDAPQPVPPQPPISDPPGADMHDPAEPVPMDMGTRCLHSKASEECRATA